MMLSDMGADVVRVDSVPGHGREGTEGRPTLDPLGRGRRSLAADLKDEAGRDVVLRLIDRADALVEGHRPGVMERLGLGPDLCLERNPRLVYARMTGWGQDGPYAQTAGHDNGYAAIAGTLGMLGSPDRPPEPPLNLVADYGGGGMLLAFGVVSGVLAAARTGLGQVVDVAMTDGAALLATTFHVLHGQGLWTWERGHNLLDGGAPFYATYPTADGRFVTVGALEPKFFGELLRLLELEEASLPAQMDRDGWPRLREALAARLASRTRDEWVEVFAGSDACVTPVLEPGEAVSDPHNEARGTFVTVDGITQPAPAPRFSHTAAPSPRSAPEVGRDSRDVLHELGLDWAEVEALERSGAIWSLPGG